MTADLTRSARLFRDEAIAALVATMRSDKAMPGVKAQAAVKLLEISDGKPQQAKQVVLTDLDKLTQQERVLLLVDLMQRCESETGILQAMMRDAVIEAAAITASNQPTPRFGFRRHAPLPALPAPTEIDAELSPLARRSTPTQTTARILHQPDLTDHERALQPPSGNDQLPPPRSPQQSPIDPTKPTHHPNGMPIRRIGDGDPDPTEQSSAGSSNQWSTLLNGYNNARCRNGHG
jgi:hypothetical protein